MASDAPLATETLHRLHPASILFGVLRLAKAFLLPLVALVLFARASSWELWAAILFVPATAFEIYRYATTRYGVSASDLVVRRGLLFRSERHVPLQRIQNVDLAQNPLHRMLGVAEVRVETAGGSEPEAVLNVLSLAAAASLRREVRGEGVSSAAGGAVGGHEPLPASERAEDAMHASGPGRAHAARAASSAGESSLVLRLPTAELVRLGLISNRGMALVFVAIGAAWELDLFERIGFERLYAWLAEQPALRSPLFLATLLLAAMVLLRLLSVIWTVLRFHGYELRLAGDDLRMTCGLLTRITATVPRGRIQLISVRRSVIQRWWKRATVRIETAGGAGSEDGEASGLQSRRWFVPIVREADLPRVLEALSHGLPVRLSQARWEPISPQGRRRRTRLALIESAAIALAGAAAAWLLGSPWLFGVGVLLAGLNLWHARVEIGVLAHVRSPGLIGLRSGALTRRESIVRTERAQVLEARQSPFDRRWGMATVRVDTAGAGAAEHSVSIPYQEIDAARSLVEELLEEAVETSPDGRPLTASRTTCPPGR